MHFNYVIRKLLKPEEICNGPCIFILGEISRGGRWCLRIQEFILINSSSWIDFLLGLLLNCVWLGHCDWEVTTKKEALDGSDGFWWTKTTMAGVTKWCYISLLLVPIPKLRASCSPSLLDLSGKKYFVSPNGDKLVPVKGLVLYWSRHCSAPGEPCLWLGLGVISQICKKSMSMLLNERGLVSNFCPWGKWHSFTRVTWWWLTCARAGGSWKQPRWRKNWAREWAMS